MRNWMKQGIAILMVVAMVLCVLPATTISSSAATYTYNWGTRGTLATELSDTAEAWYAKYNTNLDELMTYSGASSTSAVPSSSLYTKLRSLMRGAVTYTTSYESIKNLCMYTDCQNGGGKISSFYSGKEIGPTWDGTWNREHTWPNSKGDANGSGENDIFMVRPTTESENGSRGNTAYGESGSFYHPNSESNGKYDLRGDVARIVLFVYVRWQDTSNSAAVLFGSAGVMESKEVLLKWMEEDPVDTWELGRNDSCQSITGTRNVFVDYPELGFALFNADVPADYDSPSGGAAPAYTVTATSNNTSYGTVSVSGKTITATPKTGYYASGYTVTSGTATVTQNGNKFTVNASSNCSIRINFAAKTQHTVTYTAAGTTMSSSSVYSEDVITVSSYTGTAPEGFTFKGWVSSEIDDTTDKPEIIYSAGDSYTVTANTTFFALYSYSEDGSDGGSGDYVKVTKAPSDWTGEYLVVYESLGFILDGSLTSFDKSGNYKQVTITNNTISAAAGDPYKFTVTAFSSGYSLQGTSGMYFGAASAKNSLTTSSSALANTLSLNSDGSASIKGTGGYVLRFNTGDKRFRYYNGTQAAIALYVKDGKSGTTYYTTDPIKCAHGNTQNIDAVAATCTESGYTAGVYCNDCDSYISGHEAIAATGHTWGNWSQTTAPTCTVTGVQTRKCKNCTATETQTVSATGHSYSSAVTPPTTYDKGYTTYTCSVCGYSYIADYVDALGETFMVTFRVPSGVSPIAQMECGKNGITLPAAGVPTGDYEYTFAGWSAVTVESTTEEPTLYKSGDTFKATSATTLYAVYYYSVNDGNGTSNEYTKYSGALTEGDYIITYNNYAMTATISNKRFANTSFTDSDDKIVNPVGSIVWHIAPNGNYWTIYNAENEVYAAGNGTKNNSTLISSLTDYGKWTAEGQSTYEFTNLGNDNKGINALLRNNGTYGFACYSTSTGGALTLYKASASASIYYTSVFECNHSYETEITEPTYITPGCKTETCLHCGDVVTTEIPVLENPVESWNICLGDNIGVNFQLKLAALDEVTVKVAGKTVDTVIVDDKLSVEVAAAQMTDQIAISVNGLPLAKTYSVFEYADVILKGVYSDATKNLVKAMLIYGGAAQTAFAYNTGNMASIESATVTVPTEYTGPQYEGAVDGVQFYGASLVYRNKTAVRFYFTGSADGLNFTVDGDPYMPVVKGDMYYIEITGILPQDLADSIKLTVSDGTDTLSVCYGPMDYIVRMFNKADSSDAVKALTKALYGYYCAAVDYISESAEEKPTPDDVFG